MNSPKNSPKSPARNLKEPITVDLTDGLSVRLYADSRPHCMETAAIQKGLILMLDNKELIQEGVGFGVPVVKYQDKTYFSSSAEVLIENGNSTVTKTYILDSVSRKRIWRSAYINDGLYSFTRKKFALLYLGHKNYSSFFNNFMELRQLAKVRTEFQKVKPRGAIAVKYDIQPATINVSLDFSRIVLSGCEEILVQNEQGSDIFNKYVDSDDLKLSGSKIGGWDAVTADEACLLSTNFPVSFSLRRTEGATLFRGWENTKRRFSWAGLNYSLFPSNSSFSYTIGLSCKR